MDGLKMDFLSSEALEDKSSMEKISMIIDRVKDGDILVLEGSLSPSEEAELIETTMREIDIENFVGIDIYTLEKDEKAFLGLSKRRTVGLTIIGPANVMRTVKRKSNFLSMIAEIGDSGASVH
ncbi:MULTISPECIES: DUF2073 domain-containing protein [Methanothermobacter]|uniref:DUF2073 domain-containing protein n=1 Tax=Methanothermobacter marburgensis (strain ATCC BAA-927 / DSM 2133 / JCM 14651 / NBRC 100331 / OCM 82 / Marburg) TaxID=79929 RepID=D9PV24_METTM|nr:MULTISPECIES: DUF2073 domain-containing protein [Methanothermobacter]ADL58072.1 conserved hypothetical protein [Methanothermobacter marburgensis str. Marburg]MCG2828932.1 DUF2073 domain-containing protein [Methanothermobacter sp. K4]MDI9618696.1 DUF2073 domain-containing protein [Methanothermobacter sp.]QEF94071.1 DUF2073 domain-containing protein [Methanothermobacter sp. KEPCO-1]WBF10255.1 DUF2073 domain-containing protein [Methanothermobacter marburgensis]